MSFVALLLMRVCARTTRVPNQSQAVLSYTDTFTRFDEVIPQQSLPINNEEELINFFNSNNLFAHLTADIDLHRQIGGFILQEGRVLDGAGHRVTLFDEYAAATVYELYPGELYYYDPDDVNDEPSYGLFVDENYGEIKNVRFELSSSVSIVNNSFAQEISVAIVCGENFGLIHNCDLTVTKSFEYYYLSEDVNESEVYKTNFGGLVGVNRGIVANVGAKYDRFALTLRTAAGGSENGSMNIPAQTFAGGIIGMMSDDATCTNIKISGREVTFDLFGRGIDIQDSFTYAGAVAAVGWMDNVIVDFDVEYVHALTGSGEVSKNAVVHIGQAYNVTALNLYGGEENLRSKNMSSADDAELCNYFDIGDNARVQVNINYNDHQIIDVMPRNGSSGELSFIKYKSENGEISEDVDDYVNVPQNFSSRIIDGDIGMRVAAYQTEGTHFWELTVEAAPEVKPAPIPTLEVDAYANGAEYFSGNIAYDRVTFFVQATNGFVEYRIDGGEWKTCDREFIITDSVAIEFRAVSEDGIRVSDIVYYEVEVIKRILVTADWFKGEFSKDYDGTDGVLDLYVDELTVEAFSKYIYIKDKFRFSARYSQIDAGDVDIIINFWLEDCYDCELINDVLYLSGAITPRPVTVTLEQSYATYGLTDWEPVYSVSGLLGGDEIRLHFATDANFSSTPGEYSYRLAENTYGNYVVSNFDLLTAPLVIDKYVVSELIFDEEFFGAVKAGFADIVDPRFVYILDVTYELLGDNGVVTVKDKIDEVGEYRITFFMPQALSDKYVLSEEITPIELYFDDSCFEQEPDVPNTDDETDDEEKDDSTDDEIEDIPTLPPVPGITEDIDSDPSSAGEMGAKGRTVAKAVAVAGAVSAVGVGAKLYSKKKKKPSKPKLK